MRNPILDLFDNYNKIKNVTEISIDKMITDILPYKDKIILYGAGSAGIAFMHYLRRIGIEPACFSDGNTQKWGYMCEGLEIIDYHTIVERFGSDALVIVTINTDGKKYCKSFAEELRCAGHVGVHKALHDVGCKNVIDYTYFRRVRKLFCGDIYNLPSCSDIYCMEKHVDEIAEVYEWLTDNISKKVFYDIVKFRLIDDSIKIRTEPQERQYFEYSFFEKRTNEVFIDCGAYNGISLKTFLYENNNQVESYYGIEPDYSNFKQLSTYVEKLEKELQGKIHIINAAAYNHIFGEFLYQLEGPGSFISDNGTKKVQTIMIDNIVNDKDVSFIKMNIEGSELNALLGARKTITKCNPRLAIAGYHKTWDLWKVPQIIKQYNQDYKLSLRSYMNHISFVYYAY